MYKKKTVKVQASEVAEILNLKLFGRDFVIHGPASLKNLLAQSIVYVEILTPELIKRLNSVKDVLVLLNDEPNIKRPRFAYIVTPNPKLSFARIINELFVEREIRQTDSTARIAPGAKLGRNVIVGSHSVIGPDVTLGDNTIVLNNVVIMGQVCIGNNCLIKDNSTIGSEGYSFEFDEQGLPVHFPYVGRIIIEDNVWIGSNSTVERSETDDTVIESFVKIDDLVQIGQSCRISQRTMVAAGTVISVNATIGKDCWIAPNASIRDAIKIGDNVMVGIGAVVVKDLQSNGVYVGNPARFLRKRLTE